MNACSYGVTPSFSVNDKKGAWRDFGDGTGGNIIDFGLRYWPGLSFGEVLEKIVETCDGPAQNYKRQLNPLKEPKYQNPDIKDQRLQSRCAELPGKPLHCKLINSFIYRGFSIKQPTFS